MPSNVLNSVEKTYQFVFKLKKIYICYTLKINNMKKLFLLFSALLVSFASKSQTNPTSHFIGVDGCSFNPSTLTIVIGDTLVWNLQVTNSRATSSITIPSGANSWDVTLDVSNPTYKYVVTVPGNYYYKSSILPTCIASITVLGTTGINGYSQQNKTQAYPNPVKDKLTVIYPNGAKRLSLYNEAGVLVKNVVLDDDNQTNITIDITDLAYGIYIYSVYSDKGIIDTKKIIRIQ